ncbi:MAG: redoxin domain-containing protein [Anaerolineales bacterium]|nr:redoxin domain-containing protein [Anaerolineales bacterium]
MSQVSISVSAPDFTLTDTTGTPLSLSSFKDKKNIVLVFNRGFM